MEEREVSVGQCCREEDSGTDQTGGSINSCCKPSSSDHFQVTFCRRAGDELRKGAGVGLAADLDAGG